MVKNIAEPVRAFRVTPAGQEGKASAPVSGDIDLSLPDRPSIAVLPFDNMSGDAEQEYFTDGMVEEIITALSRLNWLFVIARNSSFTYKGRAVDVRQVASELGVRYVLEGSVRKAARRVRITGQLIDAHTGAHMWADRFDGELEDVFDLQDQVAESVVGAIEPRLRKAEIERPRRKRPENLQAYDLFLHALPHLNKFRPDDNAVALALLERAIALDGNYAPALAYAAWCYEQHVVHRYPASRETDAADAVRLARAAIATDSDDPGAIGTAAFVLVMVGRDHDGGLAAARRALRLNPNSLAACWTAGWVNVLGGAPEEALPIFERALRLSPADPQAHFILNGIGMAHLLLGRHPEAAATARKSASICADLDVPYWILAAACAHLEQIDEARQALATLLSLAPGTTVSWYRDKLGFKDRSHRDILLDGFRKAGMPE